MVSAYWLLHIHFTVECTLQCIYSSSSVMGNTIAPPDHTMCKNLPTALIGCTRAVESSSALEEREVMSRLMDFQPGADDYLSDRGQIFEYTMHMSILRWCHLIPIHTLLL